MISTTRTLAGAALLLAAATHGQAAERTIVVLQALTGAGAFIGAPAAEGMKFAAEEINRTGLLGADKLKLIVEDDASDRGQATAAVNRHARDPNVLLILGPTISPTAIAAAAVANGAKIPLFPMTNADAVLKAGPWSFIASQPADVTMPLLGDYVVNTLKVKNCAMVTISDNEAYVRLTQVFRESVEPRGVKFVDFAGVKSNESDFSAISTRVAAAKPECVFLFTTAPVAANLAIQLKQAGLDPKTRMIGHTALSSPDLVKIGGTAVEGIVFNADWAPGGGTPAGKAFAEAFRKATGSEPDNWNAMGYSFMYVMAAAIKNAGPNPTREGVREALAKTKDVPVVVGKGTYSLGEGRVPLYGVGFLTVQGGKFVPLQ